jgi:dethiobiotin synthetase
MTFLDDWKAKTARHANSLDTQGNPPHGIFVVGTDTDVGKTYAACLIAGRLRALGARVGVYKPVASGLSGAVASDADRLIQASGLPWPVERVCPQAFAAPLAPPLAAEREGRQVDQLQLIGGAAWWRDRCDVLIVEGAGGAMSPLAERYTVLDLASELGYPIVLVAAHRLGMINHTLLTLEAIERRGLTTLALIVNQATPVLRTQPELQVSDSLRLLHQFCSKLQCWVLEHGDIALSPALT